MQPVNNDVIERFWAKVDSGVDPAGCWVWLAGQDSSGYGLFWVGRNVKAHRFAFELAFGPIPNGRQLDHLCRQRLCVRVDHLEVVDQRTNILRGMGPTAHNARKTECDRGHPFSGLNLIHRSDGGRRCRACNRAMKRESQRRYRARRLEGQP